MCTTTEQNACGCEDICAQELLEAMPYMVMVLDEDHKVVLANTTYGTVTGCGPADARCFTAVHRLDQAIDGCPLEESARTLDAVERVIEDPHIGRMMVAVYPLERTSVEGKRLFMHIARPMV